MEAEKERKEVRFSTCSLFVQRVAMVGACPPLVWVSFLCELVALGFGDMH